MTSRNQPLNEEEVVRVRALRGKGLTFAQIRDETGIGYDSVSDVVRAKGVYSNLEPLDIGRFKKRVDKERVMRMEKELEDKKQEEKSAFDDVGKVDEQVELMREKEQTEGLRELKESRDVANRAMVNLRNALVANQKTCGMLTEAMLKLDERVVRIEKLLSKAAKG